MTRDKITKIIIVLLLVVAFVIIQVAVKNNIIAISLLGCMILLILAYLKFANSSSKRKKKNIMTKTKKIRANVLSVKRFNRGSLILSLMVEHPEKFYVTSYIIDKYDAEISNYKQDQQIDVYVNPDNKYEVFLPETKRAETESAPRQKGGVWVTIMTILITLGSIGIPFAIDLFDFSDRVFKDITIINANKNKAYIWEVRYKSPKRIFIKIYDPITKETVKTIKDKKEDDLDHYTDFFISQQNDKVYIIGTGNTPVIDVYNASTFEKLSDIKKFEETSKLTKKSLLKRGIASIKFETPFNRLKKDDVIELTTNDGNKCYYNISNDQFYYSENEVKEYFADTDYAMLSMRMFSFVLSSLPNSVDKHQLYILETNNKKGLQSIHQLSGSNSLNVDYFNENKKYSYKYCVLTPLCPEDYFLKGKIIYSDASIVIIQHVTAINDNAEELISGIDNSGKTLFTIKESDYPNVKDMKEDNYHPRDNDKTTITRNDNSVVFLFEHYGGLCVDIKTANILWKYEP